MQFELRLANLSQRIFAEYFFKWRFINSWKIGVILITLLFSLPLLTVVASLFADYSPLWQHLLATVMSDYLINSLLLMLGVGCGTFLLGVSTAWVVCIYEFPGRRLFEWLLLLPMAMPAYIIGYVYTGMLDFSGPLQTHMREIFAWQHGDYWFPQIRSLAGAIFVMSLVLYPYVYLIARASFMQQSRGVLEASRTLGCSLSRSFFKVALPLSRPAIVAGMSLAMMEALADYGTVQYFGVSTFTTGIFRTWFGMGELQTATQLSSFLLMFVFLLIVIEAHSRKQLSYHSTSRSQQPAAKNFPGGFKRFICLFICMFPVLLGFVLPALQLSYWALLVAEGGFDSGFLNLMLNTFYVAAFAALICLLAALFLCYSKRIFADKTTAFSVRLTSMSYAIPGTVIAVAILAPLSWFDNRLDAWLAENFQLSSGLLLSGSLFALLFAYSVRFLSVSVQTLQAGLVKITSHFDESARSLAHKPLSIFKKIHFPLLQSSLLTALILVFVDVLKELPATLILRPFNFNTLAVRTYELASDERLVDAALPALAIVIIGLLPIIILFRNMQR